MESQDNIQPWEKIKMERKRVARILSKKRYADYLLVGRDGTEK